MKPYIDRTPFELAALSPDEETKLEMARAAYSNALNDILERVASEFDDPNMKQIIAQDFAMFAAFLASTKMVEAANQPPWRKKFLSALEHLNERIKREVPEFLIELARDINGGRAMEDGGMIQ